MRRTVCATVVLLIAAGCGGGGAPSSFAAYCEAVKVYVQEFAYQSQSTAAEANATAAAIEALANESPEEIADDVNVIARLTRELAKAAEDAGDDPQAQATAMLGLVTQPERLQEIEGAGTRVAEYTKDVCDIDFSLTDPQVSSGPSFFEGEPGDGFFGGEGEGGGGPNFGGGTTFERLDKEDLQEAIDNDPRVEGSRPQFSWDEDAGEVQIWDETWDTETALSICDAVDYAVYLRVSYAVIEVGTAEREPLVRATTPGNCARV